MQIIELAGRLLEKYPLCDRCLGRQFALLVSGSDNSERGRALKLILTAKAHKMILEGEEGGTRLLEKLAENGFFEPALQTLEKKGTTLKESSLECHLCKGRLDEIDQLTKEIIHELAKLRFKTFLVGIRIPSTILDEEDEIRSKLGIIWGEEIRNEFSREIGKIISRKSEKVVDHRNPEVSIFVDPFKNKFQVRVNPVYLIGRYLKREKGIRQLIWRCKTCNGIGCPNCDGKGKTLDNSIEEILSESVEDMMSCDEIIFRPVGREDVDTIVLGRGRPFILEVRGAKEIPSDLGLLRQLINRLGSGKIEVTELARTTREKAQKFTTRNQTTVFYRITAKLKDEINAENLEELEREFSKVLISQYMHSERSRRRRRRQKYIYETSTRRLAPNQIELIIKCQGGIRIRDLISGIDFKTEPAMVNILDTDVSEIQIEVLDVRLEGLDEEI
ncbi:MAG: tRNA pseudouridine(54/55) synthase Pus10 [Candidatus Bathyarchaeota archaeon]|nr:MAG: tRNA pseudouridine(54/55) synthase Pus10 [Candidatus Bathyarchaeota archaeon]